jgi:hypothetical protein
MLTRANLVTEFRRWIDQPNTAIVSSAMANYEISRAYKELIAKVIERNYRFYYKSASLSTVAATARVAVPSDSVLINKLIDSDKVVMPHKDLEMFDHSLSNGTPSAWDTAGRYIYFQPIPDAIYVYTCYYTYMPADFTGDSSTPEFIPGYEDLIAIKAAINSKMIRDESVKDMAQMAYYENLKSFLNAVSTQQTSSGRRVIVSQYDLGD